MQTNFFQTRDVWLTREIPSELREALTGSVTKPGKEFWKVVNRQLIPAVRANNRVRRQAALTAAGTAFEQHRKSINQLTAAEAGNLLGDAGELVDYTESFRWDRREGNQSVAVEPRGRSYRDAA